MSDDQLNESVDQTIVAPEVPVEEPQQAPVFDMNSFMEQVRSTVASSFNELKDEMNQRDRRLQGELQQLRQPAPAQPNQRMQVPDPFTDPNGYVQFNATQAAAQAVSAVDARLQQQQQFNAQIDMAYSRWRAENPDFTDEDVRIIGELTYSPRVQSKTSPYERLKAATDIFNTTVGNRLNKSAPRHTPGGQVPPSQAQPQRVKTADATKPATVEPINMTKAVDYRAVNAVMAPQYADARNKRRYDLAIRGAGHYNNYGGVSG